jgi:hypothetical protein
MPSLSVCGHPAELGRASCLVGEATKAREEEHSPAVRTRGLKSGNQRFKPQNQLSQGSVPC